MKNAAIVLVNDLDLLAVNIESNQAFIGNTIAGQPLAWDSLNNVEQVNFTLPAGERGAPLFSKVAVHVIGSKVPIVRSLDSTM